jgi:hypothetical protein
LVLLALLVVQAGAGSVSPARAQGVSTPTLTLLSPSEAALNSGPVDLTATGTGFVEGAIIDWNSTPAEAHIHVD